MKYLVFLLFAQLAFCSKRPTDAKGPKAATTTSAPTAQAQQTVSPEYVFKESDKKPFVSFTPELDVAKMVKYMQENPENKVVILGKLKDLQNRQFTVTILHGSQPNQTPNVYLKLTFDEGNQTKQYKNETGKMCYDLLQYLVNKLNISISDLLDRTNFSSSRFDSSFREGFNSKTQNQGEHVKLKN